MEIVKAVNKVVDEMYLREIKRNPFNYMRSINDVAAMDEPMRSVALNAFHGLSLSDTNKAINILSYINLT